MTRLLSCCHQLTVTIIDDVSVGLTYTQKLSRVYMFEHITRCSEGNAHLRGFLRNDHVYWADAKYGGLKAVRSDHILLRIFP